VPVSIFIELVVDRIRLSVVIGSGELYSFAVDQLFEMEALQKDFLPTGVIRVKSKYSSTRLDYYPVKGRKIADIEVLTGKGKVRYFWLGLYPSKFKKGEFEKLKEVLALFLEPFEYVKLFHTARVSYIELAVDSLSFKNHSFVPFVGKLQDSYVYTDQSGEKGSIYLGSESGRFRFIFYDKAKEIKEKLKQVPKYSIQTRVEARVRGCGLTADELSLKLKNPFVRVEIAEPSKFGSACDNADFKTFISRCSEIGYCSARRELPIKIQRAYLKLLRDAQAWWWNPKKIWQNLDQALTVIAP
jgi:hypothetical protein